jgi:UDP-glucuronate decarboxylase
MTESTVRGRAGARGRALVAGGAGFVGSHLCERLVRDGWSVVALDDFTTGSPRNVAHLRESPKFRLAEHDVTAPFDLPADRIYNLACPASPPHYQRDPVRTTLINVLGAKHCLDLARATGARFLQASTSEVYGDPEVHPQPEGYRGSVNPIGVRSCYDEGKRCAESLTMDYRRSYGVEVRLARIFNTYGPRMDPDDGRVVSNFVVQALRGESLTVYGDGQQTRSFCYVDDLVDGLVRLMEHPTECGPVNLGNPVEFTVLSLAHEVAALCGGRARVVCRALPQDDPRLRRPDIGVARRVLGFEPRVPLRDGLARTITYFRARLELESTEAVAAGELGRGAAMLGAAQ